MGSGAAGCVRAGVCLTHRVMLDNWAGLLAMVTSEGRGKGGIWETRGCKAEEHHESGRWLPRASASTQFNQTMSLPTQTHPVKSRYHSYILSRFDLRVFEHLAPSFPRPAICIPFPNTCQNEQLRCAGPRHVSLTSSRLTSPRLTPIARTNGAAGYCIG